jgi:hypothetical protein
MGGVNSTGEKESRRPGPTARMVQQREQEGRARGATSRTIPGRRTGDLSYDVPGGNDAIG